MPIESGQYCSYCTDDAGALQPFDLRFEAMVSWSLKEDSSQSRSEAEKKTLTFMSSLPAWREHPEVNARLAKFG